MYKIYRATSKTTKKSYFGSTKSPFEKRKQSHKTTARKHTNNWHFHNAIRKYGWEDFEWTVVAMVGTQTQCEDLERWYIERYNTTDRRCGYNMTKDTRRGRWPSMKGKKFTEEHKKKIGNANRGKKHTAESLQKMSKAQMGRTAWNKGKKGSPHSEETKRKMSESHKSSKKSADHIARLSVTNKGNKYAKK